jgi:hypothetical protein
VALGLLKQSNIETLQGNDYTFEELLLNSCHADLLNSSDFHAFVAALKQQSMAFLSVLKEESIKRRVCQHLHHDLNINKEAAALFISQLLLSSNMSNFLQNLVYQQYLHHLRRVVSDYQLTVALPAQALSTKLLTALPLLSLAEEQAQQLPELSLSVLKAISQKIVAKSLPPEVLATVLVMDWDSVLVELAHLTEEHHSLISTDLVKQLRTMHSAAAQTHAEKFNCYLTASYPPLSATASVNEALMWSEGYFDYLRPVLLNKQIPDESINGSFTEWLLLAKSARITRSNADWRYCAKQINKFLAQNYLVVVVMIDALSALNQDILLTQLASFEQLISTNEMLFAPLPTLTEIGKMAVLTGKHSHLLPSDSETALRQTYSAYLSDTNALKVIKSWEDVNQHIEAHTNLVVFFENRIDERLHDCVNFDKHRSDISPIVRQLKTSMQRWLKDAGQRDVVFFITADHGMMVTQGVLQGCFDEIKDRAMKVQHGDNITDDFVLMKQDSKNPYAIVKTRAALTYNTALAHGGLTPEEVLIPFITLTTRPPLPNKMPLDVNIIGNCTRLGNKYWQLVVRLTASEQVETLKFSLEPPFNLEKCHPIDIIRAHKSQDIILKFTADCEQQDLIALDLQLYYDRASVHEKNTHHLEINFPPPLLERDADTQKFDGAFDE